MFVRTSENIAALIAVSERFFLDQGVEQEVPFCFPLGNERLWGDAEEGQEAWFEIGENKPREFRKFLNGAWVPDPTSVDNG
ncbi:MAG: hypothetical protein RLY66_642 [Candidatus Parcubacteria bacterium]|jgi:malate synthase